MMLVRATVPVLVLAAMIAAQTPEHPAADPLAVKTLGEAWQVAQSMLRTHKVPVLVFVLPPADQRAEPPLAKAAKAKLEQRFAGQLVMGNAPELASATARDVFLLQLQGLRSSSDEALHRLMTWNLVVVAEAKVCGAAAGETVVLLGQDGKRAAGWALDLLDEDAVRKALAPRLLDERLLATRRANLDPALQRDVDDLARLSQQRERTPAEEERLQQVSTHLLPLAPVVAPSLPALAEGPRGRGQLGMTTQDWLFGAELPLGTAIQQIVDPCMGCGMGFTPPRLVSTLRLLAQ